MTKRPGSTNDRLLRQSLSFLFLIAASLATNSIEAQQEELSKLLSASPEKYDELIEGLKAHSVNDLVKGAVVANPVPSDERVTKMIAGWSGWSAVDSNGIERPYQVYLSKAVAEGKRPTAVVMHMHGAVGRPQYGNGLGETTAVGYGAILWQPVADEEDILLICPQAKADCAWWTDAGVDHLHAVLRDVRRMISIPDLSIFATGFSDGASGCYYLATVAPDPFAGFIAMNGHPVVASSASNKQIYLRNLANTPIIAAMTQMDSLYPSSSVLPHITAAVQSGASIHVISYPLMNHQPSYFEDQKTTFVNFLKSKQRVSAVRTRWLSSSVESGRVQNVEMLKIGAREGDRPALRDINPMTTPGRVRLGVQLPTGNQEGRVKLVEVVEGSAADSAGLKSGDIVESFDGVAVTNVNTLRRLIAVKRYGQSFSAVVKRGSESKEIEGRFPEFEPRPSFRRSKDTAFIDVGFREEQVVVASSNVLEARIWLPPLMTGKSELAVSWNGKEKRYPVKSITSQEWLERFAETGDRADFRLEYIDLK